MNNKSVCEASFYYSLEILKLLQDMKLVSDEQAIQIKESLSSHYQVTDIYYS